MAEPYDDESVPTTLLRKGAAAASAADDRAHYLVVVAGAEPGRRFDLGDKGGVIGRTKPADFVISDTLISRNHCRVAFAAGQLFVTDLGSSNGTFIAGARIEGPRLVAPGERFTVGSHVFEHEYRSRREVQEDAAQDSDLDKAKLYVRSLLPEPIAAGAVQTDWVLQPSAKLGGDMFGYHFIDKNTFAIYLLDVTGHGTDAAMHAVSVMNVLRQRAPPGVDARDPARMVGHLNEMFPMESHGGMLLSLWYGVVNIESRTVAFVSAGHHAAYVVGPDRAAAVPLDVSNVLVGMISGFTYTSAQSQIPPGSSLYLFSDGVFEIEAMGSRAWGGNVEDFVPLLTAPTNPDKPESRRILEAVMARTGRESFEDDFTLVVATFR